MAIKQAKVVSSGKGTPNRLEGRNGDMTVRLSGQGKRLYVKDLNKWHGVNLDIDALKIRSDVNSLLKEIRGLKNRTRNKPVLDAAFFRKSGSSLVHLKNTAGYLHVRNADDSADANIVCNTIRCSHVVDANNIKSIEITATGSAVNYLKVNNSAAGAGVALLPAGDDSNVNLQLQSKGTGHVIATPGGTGTFQVRDATTVKYTFLQDDCEARWQVSAADMGKIDCDTAGVFRMWNVTDGAAAHIKISAVHDVYVNAGGNQIYLAGGGASSGDTFAGGTTFGYFDFATSSTCKLLSANNYHLNLIGSGSGDIVLDAGGDIELNADGGDITFKDNTTNLGSFDSSGNFTVLGDLGINPSGGETTILSTAATTGILKIATTATTATDADIILDAGGDIALDSGTGVFRYLNAGTEFSVANSAYAGMILGYTTVGIDATADASSTLDTTMTVIDDALKVKFVAPPSGVVEIMAQIYFDTTRRAPVLGLSDQNATTGYQAISFPNATDVTNEHVQAVPPTTLGDHMLRPHWVVTGLTAGTAYEWWIAAKTTVATGGVLRWGGTATNEYPPFIMKATSLPTATADYAVYG